VSSIHLIRDISKLAFSGGAALSFTALKAVLILRFLDPHTMGVWKLAMLLMPAIGLLRLSFSSGMGIRVPYLLGQGSEAEAGRMASTAGTLQVGNGLIFAAGSWICSWFVTDPSQSLALKLMAFVLVASQTHNFLRDVVIAYQHYDARAKSLVMAAALDSVLCLALAPKFGILGLGIGTVLGFAIPSVYLWWQIPLRLRPHWNLKRARSLWTAGWPIALTDTGGVIMRYLDVALLGWIVGPVAVGWYALSQAVADLSVYLTRLSLNEVVSPHLLRQAGRAEPTRRLAMSYEHPVWLLCFAIPPLAIIVSAVIPPVVTRLLPAYANGILAAQIMIWGVLFISIQACVQPFLAATGGMRPLLLVLSCLVPVSAAAQVIVLRGGFGVAGAASVAVVSSAVLAVASLLIALRRQEFHWFRRVRRVALLLIPTLVLAALNATFGGLAAKSAIFALAIVSFSMALFNYTHRLLPEAEDPA
jgi:O-antigen/teichoic acid export membrane protein